VEKRVGNKRVREIESLGIIEEDNVMKIGNKIESICNLMYRKL
jgi:hypothetical protein